MSKCETVIINGAEYVRRDLYREAKKLDDMPYVLIRTYSAGVFAGYLAERDGKDYSYVVQKLKIAVDALNTILMASQKSEESHALNVYYTAHDAISKIEVKNETVG